MRSYRLGWSLVSAVILILTGAAITVRSGILSALLAQAPPARNPRPPPPVPDSLKTVRPAEDPALQEIVRDRQALVVLGKALFWDMQVGSDNVQACATCHFHAGADPRVNHQINPGPDNLFQAAPVGGALTPSSFPFHRLFDPDDKTSRVLSDTDDRASSQGVSLHDFVDVRDAEADLGLSMPDPVFSSNGWNVRRVEPRNAPTTINAVFNLRNFWDGRADRTFNGVDPFGDLSPAKILVSEDGGVVFEEFRLRHSSLASQAVGPPMSPFEMSFGGRAFPNLGKKLVGRRPLAMQEVHPEDSVLAPYRSPSGRGLDTTYGRLIETAFAPKYWQSDQIFTCRTDCTTQPNCGEGVQIQPMEDGGVLLREQFTLMEMNFSLFFGIAVQAYEATLISDDAPFDRFREGDTNALTPQQKHGLELFISQDDGRCINCHKGPDFTGAGFVLQNEERQGLLMERMPMNDGGVALYDNGFYNIGVRPPEEDIGLGGTAPSGKPLSFTRRFVAGEFNETDNCKLAVPFPVADCFVQVPLEVRAQERQVVDGAFKTPTLRNVELTGPYFHNGGQATLEQVVQFYNRGGDFQPEDFDIRFIGLTDQEVADIVAFLKSLTDDRVRYERAPFDHPQLCVPHGPVAAPQAAPDGGQPLEHVMLNVPAVGRNGGPPLSSFEQILDGTGPPHFDGPCRIPGGMP